LTPERALLERGGELLADRALPVDVHLEGDAPARPADGREHLREDLVAVDECPRAVPRHERRTEDHAHRANELGIADAVERRHAGVDLLVAEREIGRDEHRERRGEERQDADAPGGVAPPAHRA